MIAHFIGTFLEERDGLHRCAGAPYRGPGIAWLALVEAGHRLRKQSVGDLLARIDRSVRYCVAIALPTAALFAFANAPAWFGAKLSLFGGVIACGVVIRFILFKHFVCWALMTKRGPIMRVIRLSKGLQ